MIKPTDNSNYGGSLVELLLALMFLTTISSLIYPLVKSTLQTTIAISRQEEREKILSTATTLLRQLEHQMRFRGIASLWIQSPSEVLSPAILKKYGVSQDSSALTVASFDTPAVFRISADNKLCSEQKPETPNSKLYWIAIRVNSEPTIVRSGQSAVLTDGLWCIERSWLKSVSLPQTVPYSSSPFLSEQGIGLIPLRDLWTLYLDRNGFLRRFSQLTKEHQPILKGLSRFELTANESNVNLANVTLETSGDGIFQRNFKLFVYQRPFGIALDLVM